MYNVLGNNETGNSAVLDQLGIKGGENASWAVNAAAWVAGQGFLTNYTTGTSEIDLTRPIRREDLAYLLNEVDVKMNSQFTSVLPETSANFTDLGNTNFAEAIMNLASRGVIAGEAQADGTFKFNPKNLITRAQVAKMWVVFLNRASDLFRTDAGGFSDVKPTDWFYNYVMNAAFPLEG
jgi:hypothetical protein